MKNNEYINTNYKEYNDTSDIHRLRDIWWAWCGGGMVVFRGGCGCSWYSGEMYFRSNYNLIIFLTMAGD